MDKNQTTILNIDKEIKVSDYNKILKILKFKGLEKISINVKKNDKKEFFIYFCIFSLLFHASFIALIGKQENIEEQLISLNLSSFKELKKTAVSVPEKKIFKKLKKKKLKN